MYSDRSLQKIHIESPVGSEELCHDVSTEEQLKDVPEELLSGDPNRPLKYVDNSGNSYSYVLKPMSYCVFAILLLEGLERLSYYGISYTLTAYLKGTYDDEWNAGYDPVKAASLTQISTAIAYTAPFIGAIVADGFIGTYWTIVLFTGLVYIPGLLLAALSAYPQGVSDTFPVLMVNIAFMAFYPLGAGAIKACVNVLGANQFHAVLQSEQLSNYYVSFYMLINIGALAGGISLPIVCQMGGINVFYAYLVPVICLTLGLVLFVAFTKRYVLLKPQGSVILQSVFAGASSLASCPPSLEKTKIENGGRFESIFVEKVKIMGCLFPLMMYIVPFNIIYGQMLSVYIIQGSVMKSAAFIDASWMQNFDALAVLIFGYLIGSVLYPALEKRGIHLHMMTKFSIGTFLGCCSMGSAIAVDYAMKSHYASTGEMISVLWQAPAFMFVGAGEIFAISSAYEAAYRLSPDGFKAFGSAINLFFIGGVANYISTAILNGCSSFFVDNSGNDKLKTMGQYYEATVVYYLWILFGLGILGGLICLAPFSKRFYSYVERKTEQVALASLDN
mmetsp:Transcript_26761/g.43039  ORF Transcript_26761/g.43039 Transcript_26761/m.43039 type:complete len:560 (+) Transcript_26761:124-1803(+)